MRYLPCCLLAALVLAPSGPATAQQFPYLLLEDTTEVGEEYSLYYELAPTRVWTRDGGARVAFDVQDQANLRYATFSLGRVAVVEVSAGKAKDLAQTKAFRPKGQVKVTIQRRSGSARVIADDSVLLTVPLPAPPGGKVGAGSRGDQIRCLEALLQPIAPIYFSDDFTRGRTQMAVWRTHSGSWENTEVDAPGADPVRSANPFSVRCSAPQGALATAGEWFWDVYRAQVNVKPLKAEAVGLCAYLQDGANYLLFRWRAGDEAAPRARQLVLVRDGQEHVLSQQAGGFEQGRWYCLALEVGDGVAVAKVDRDPVLRAQTEAFGQGGIGLWAQGEVITFDDVEVVSPGLRPRKLLVNETFLKDSVMRAQGLYTAQGAWRVANDGTLWHRGVFFGDVAVRVPAAVAQRASRTLELLGREIRGGRVPIRPPNLTLCLRATEPDPASGYRVTVQPEGNQAKVLVQRGEAALGQWQGELHAEGHVEVAWRDGRLLVSVDDAEVVSVAEDQPPAGRSLALMGAASVSSPTQPLFDGEWGAPGTRRGPRIRQWRIVPNTGLQPRDAGEPEDAGMILEPLPAAEVEFDIAVPQAEAAPELIQQTIQPLPQLRGNVVLRLNDEVIILEGNDLQGFGGLGGGGFGAFGFGGGEFVLPGGEANQALRILRPATPMPSMPALEVYADNWLDYTFAKAPTDWYATKGDWHVTTRWPCEPGWTFLGGVHYENPVTWTKHSYQGDIAFEVRTNIQMDLRSTPGYSDPSDIDLALCGDGLNLDSGYAFIYAGWGNSKSAILRKGQIVAENTGAVFVNPTSSNSSFHRHWFRLRAEKMGNRIRFLCDDQLVCEYVDPDPLPGGRAGMWSAGNNLMVARAQLWYEKETPAPLPRLPGAPPLREPVQRVDLTDITNTFERDMGEWHTLVKPVSVRLDRDNTTASAGKHSLKITNLRPGGSMVAYALTEGFRASQWRHLSFDYRIPPEVKVDVYLYLGDAWHTVRLTGGYVGAAGVHVLGSFDNVQADGRWHHAEFDLLPPLQKLYPQRQVFPVDYLAFASPDERYLRCGIGGNPMGAAYWIDEFRLTP
ncbi:MAG: hypothetical protein ACE5R4_16010 [Armatimonadota bacterium]